MKSDYRHLARCDGHFNLVIILVLLSLMLQAYICYLYSDIHYLLKRQAQPKYFATNPYGVLTPLEPLLKPSLSNQAVTQFATDTATNAFTYNYLNQPDVFEQLHKSFTTSGWKSFLESSKKSNIVNTIKTNRLVLSAVAKRTPVIVEEGVAFGRYTWLVKVPMLVSYHSADQVVNHDYQVTMRISRRSTLDAARGVGVAEFTYNTVNAGRVS